MAFREQVEEGIKDFTLEQKRAFAWRCAVRALPMIGYKGHLDFWEKDTQQKYLQSLFLALDTIFLSNYSRIIPPEKIRTIPVLGNELANIANENNDDVIYSTYYAIAFAYRGAHNILVDLEWAIDDIGRAANYVISAYFHVFGSKVNDRFKRELFQDIKTIKEGGNIITDLTIYGNIGERFLTLLKNEGCEYWANWYQQLFENNFKFDEEEVQQRINVPEEIREQGAAAVGRYMQRLKAENTERLNEARIIILGDKGAGKTCLARKLKDIDAPMTEPEESTAGVDTSLWKKDNINIRIWDFAGHTVTHAVHKFFLSERCLYVMVYDGRSEARNRLEYWLDHMKNYGKDSEAIIIVNERDQHIVKVAENRLKEKYPIVGFYYLNLQEDREKLVTLTADISKYIKEKPSWKNQEIPESYYKVKQELEKRFNHKQKQKGQELLKKTTFAKIAKEYGVDDAEQLLKDLHALGISLWYPEMEQFGTLILNPEWISQGVYKIINWVSNQKRYSLTLDCFNKVFKAEQKRFPKNRHQFLFDLIKHYKLAYEKEAEKRLVIPHLFNEDQPAELPKFDITDSLMIQFKSEQPLPPNTISKFIVHYNEQIQEDKVWRYGVILEDDNGGLALVREQDRMISVSVKGVDKTNFISDIRATLNEIFASYKTQHPSLNYRIIGDNLPLRDDLWIQEKAIVGYNYHNKPYFDPITGQNFSLTPTMIQYNITHIHVQGLKDIETLVLGGQGHQITKNTFNFENCNIELQGGLNELAQRLEKSGNQEEATELIEAIEILEEVEQETDKKVIKKKGIHRRLRRIIEDLGDEESRLHKTVEGIRNGVSIAQDIAKQYNNLAQWLGLPQVPKPFLKKED